METTAFVVAISVAILTSIGVAITLPFMVSGRRARAAQEKARARHLADARMNARLLRLNL
jgi:hypothetical protein